MVTTRATVTTEKPAVNLKKLCRHFGHKVEARFDDERGEVHFPFGDIEMAAGEGVLVLSGRAGDGESLARLEQVVGDHLVRFAWKESLQVDWRRDA
ncbi:DUF2218 domain-containing protein [Arhodomonas aquaeolei]|uniref:DUF2218 domain-containing protein n=1 Tax=Arhodomonas aquaeolei TaxID=2369 RepID=UPI00037B20ED|nr:DUF2218 domain-containing protein [Arhodomonas aquaeolei]